MRSILVSIYQKNGELVSTCAGGAILAGAGLTGAEWNSETIWTAGFTPPS